VRVAAGTDAPRILVATGVVEAVSDTVLAVVFSTTCVASGVGRLVAPVVVGLAVLTALLEFVVVVPRVAWVDDPPVGGVGAGGVI
jgi:hypothetical protein